MTHAPPPAAAEERAADALAAFLARHAQALVLTGAGCSTASGIPAYRDAAGEWVHPPPVQHAEFLARESTQRRYWARSLVGWPRIDAAMPNPAHAALARLQRRARLGQLITQNVDGLHQRSGSAQVTELHGSLHRVSCLDCGASEDRAAIQSRMLRDNPAWQVGAAPRPDGDAEVSETALASFRVPVCSACGGVLKPAVVFFGETIPAAVTAQATRQLDEAEALLVIGSSLMVFSGYRLARAAAVAGKPVAAVNLGRTRADDLLALKVVADCVSVLPAVARRLLGA